MLQLQLEEQKKICYHITIRHGQDETPVCGPPTASHFGITAYGWKESLLRTNILVITTLKGQLDMLPRSAQLQL